MQGKVWYKSKTIWTAVVVAGVVILQSLGVNLPYETVYGLCAAFGLYGVRDAVSKIKAKE